MGKAKEEMMEMQALADVASALGINPEDLDGYSYEVCEDTDRAGNVIRTYIQWDDELPNGVEEDLDGIKQTTVVFGDEPDPFDEND